MMSAISVLPSPPALRFNPSGLPDPGTPGQQAFREIIKDKIRSQYQQFSAPSQMHILSQLYGQFEDMPAGALPDEASIGGVTSMVDAAMSFAIQLKQVALHQLDGELARRFLQQLTPEAAIPAMRAAVAEHRLQALGVIPAANSPLLRTCLDEHIASAKQQVARGETECFIAQLPDIVTKLKMQSERCKDQLLRMETGLKNEVETRLQQMVATAIEQNKASITGKNLLLQDETDIQCREIGLRERDCDEIRDNYADKKRVLSELLAQLAEKKIPGELPPGTLPETLHESIQALRSCQQDFLHAQQEYGTGVPVPTPDLKKMQQHLRQLELDIGAEKRALQTAESGCNTGSAAGDILLSLKQLFGRGKGQKKRTEYRRELMLHTATLPRLEEQAIALRKHCSKEVRLLEALFAERRATLQALTGLKTQRCEALCALINAEMEQVESMEQQQLNARSEAYWNIRGNIVDREEMIGQDIRRLEDDNSTLLRMQTGEPLSHISALRKRFAGQAELSRVDEDYTQWQQIKSEKHPLREDIRKLNKAISEASGILHLCQVSKEDGHLWADRLRAKLPSIGIDITPPLPVDTRPLLADASHLYAMLCVDKVHAHPLSGEADNAEALTPHALKNLTALEKVMNQPGVLPENDKKKYREGKSPAESLARINNKIQGLRMIIGNDLQDTLLSAGDFSAQFYHPGQDMYIDRQGKHGTCVMHTWNNMMAHVTGNQQMMLTPWRMEKWIQSLVTQAVAVKLDDLLNKTTMPSPAVVDDVLRSIIHASGLVHPYHDKTFIEHGHVMSFEDNVLEIKSSNLDQRLPRMFERCGIRSEVLEDCYFGENVDDHKQMAALHRVQENNYDAIAVGFHGGGGEAGHALALLKQGDDYLLVDSNYDAPIPLSLSQIFQFINGGSSASEALDKVLQERGYQKYKNMYFHFGLYKRDKAL